MMIKSLIYFLDGTTKIINLPEADGGPQQKITITNNGTRVPCAFSHWNKKAIAVYYEDKDGNKYYLVDPDNGGPRAS